MVIIRAGRVSGDGIYVGATFAVASVRATMRVAPTEAFMTGEQIRLKRLFSSGNVVIVAVDHGLYNGPLAGMIDLPRVVQSLIDADAILMSPGMPTHCAENAKRPRGSASTCGRPPWRTCS